MQLSPHWSIGRCTVEGIQKELSPPLHLSSHDVVSRAQQGMRIWALHFHEVCSHTLIYPPFSHFSRYSSGTTWLSCQCEGQACGCRSFLYSRGLPSTQTWTEAFVQIKSCGMTDLNALWESRLWEEEKLSGASRQSVTLYTWGASLAGC